MAKNWRWIIPVAAAGGLITAASTVPAQAASVSTYSISIHAKNPNFPNVTGDTLVVYGQKGLQNATIGGTVTGASAGDVVTLLAEPFKATHYSRVGTPLTLTSSTQLYSFSVRPTLATKYKAQVTTGTAIDATSKVQSVYVALAQVLVRNGAHEKCGRTECSLTVKTRTLVPGSAYRTETTKHWYLYLAVNRSHGAPSTRAPKYLPLSTTSSTSKARKVGASSYYLTWTFRWLTRGEHTYPIPNACTKDAVTKDGLGLPGHHGCGAKKVRSNVIYLG
jgi:hypothetical protein